DAGAPVDVNGANRSGCATVTQVPTAVVISTANTSCRRPATALPSSISSSISASGGSEAFGLDRSWLVPEPHERLGHGLDERRRPAGEETRLLGWSGRDLGQHLGVDASPAARPPGRLRIGQRVRDREAVAAQVFELVAIDEIVLAACGVEQACFGVVA